MVRTIKVGLLGLGTVGTGVVKVLQKFDYIEVKKIAVKNINKVRSIEGLDSSIITDDAFSIVNDPEIDIVIEVIGGINPALDLIKKAIENKKHVVTANKELVAKYGKDVFELAKEKNVVVLYEAAVAGGIPIIMPLKQSLAGNSVSKVAGILNGTTNFILTKMEEEGESFEDVLKEAQDLGYAEADPSGDVQGFDAAYKIAILASIAFNKRINVDQVHKEGIDKISPDDISYAADFGYTIKLIALAQDCGEAVDVRVHPMLVKENHQLAGIKGVLNAVVIEGDAVGQVMFSGPGAGELPTASSVSGDVLSLAIELKNTDYALPMMRCTHTESTDVLDINKTYNKYYIRLNADNHPGVIGDLGTICGNNKINLNGIIQLEILKDGSVDIVLLTGLACEQDVKNAVKEFKDKDVIKEIRNIIRVLD